MTRTKLSSAGPWLLPRILSIGLVWIPLALSQDSPTPIFNFLGSADSANQADLSWTNPVGATAWFLQRATSRDFTSELVSTDLPAQPTNFSATGLAPDTLYFFRIRASLPGNGVSAWSNPFSIRTLSATIRLAADPFGTSRIDLTWTDPFSDESAWRVEAATDPEFLRGNRFYNLGTDTTGYSDGNLTAGTTYYYRVRPYRNGQWDSGSNVASVATAGTNTSPGNQPGGPAPNFDTVVQRITEAELRTVLSYLADDSLRGRAAGDRGEILATDYIQRLWQRAGLKAANGGSFFQPFDLNGRSARNTCALLEGTNPNEIIVLGAHHDHLGYMGGPVPGAFPLPVNGDTIFNGADDNGSGTTVVAVLGKILAQSGLKPKRSILFLTFSGEEWGLRGSRYYTSHLLFPKEAHLAMVNADMVGRLGDRKVLVAGLGTEAGTEFESLVQRACDKVGLAHQDGQYPGLLGGDSDHSSFRDIGVPDMFWFSGFHDDYHRVTDSVDKIDFAGLEKISRAIASLIWEMANSDVRWQFQDLRGCGCR